MAQLLKCIWHTVFTVLLSLVIQSLGAKEMQADEGEIKNAVFAGGCFWCLEPAFDHVVGVVKTTVGYTGGKTENPDYYTVATGKTGHFEAIEVQYNSKLVTYSELVEVFWRNIDPTQKDGQFADRGSHYRTAIFYGNEDERLVAERSKVALQESGKFSSPIATLVLPSSKFYPAEEEHQDYYLKQSGHYDRYKEGSGRGPFLRRMWGK